MKERLTKTVIENVKPQAKDTWISDAKLPGFYGRITPQGQRLYYARYSRNGQRFTVALGKHGAITCETARKAAAKIMGEVTLGGNPAVDRKAAREDLTLKRFSELYTTDYAEVHLKANSQRLTKVCLKTYIVPALGSKRLANISPSDVERMHLGLKETPVSANRCVALLNAMLNVARRWGYRKGPNPCEGIRRFKETARRRYLAPEEVVKLAAAIKTAEDAQMIPWQSAALFRLLLLTGARSGELLNLRWSEVDLANDALNLTDSKTGAKTIRLNGAAAVILGKLERGGEWVFPHPRRTGKRIAHPKHSWAKVLRLAKITNCHLHDLRHSYASFGVSAGLTLPVLGALLGHTQAQTTSRYSHLMTDPLRAAVNVIGDALAELMKDKQGAEIIEVGGGQAAEAKEAAK